MSKPAFLSKKNKQRKKGTTLHRRLLLFFIIISISLIALFTLLMIVLGLTGKEEKALQHYFQDETAGIQSAVSDDFGSLAVDGINLAERLSVISEHYFADMDIAPSQLAAYPQYIEGLLSQHAQTLLSTVSSRSCGGVFVLLDATIKPDGENADYARSGIFIKKTQPNSTQAVGVKLHYLRGPAQIARNAGVELLGQWKMEFDTRDQEFFSEVMETARNNPDLPLSRLYYWSGRVTLKGDSEAGFLLCIPMRSSDGTVFGVCGIQVSDRMFKTLYSPENAVYENAFAVASPSSGDNLCSSRGIIAGNYYLTGTRLSDDLRYIGDKNGFQYFAVYGRVFGGQTLPLRLYPSSSPYEEETWALAVLMPESVIDTLSKGNLSHFIYIVISLVAVSLVASFLISRRYLRPVTEALNSIKTSSGSSEDRKAAPYLEINDLFEFLDQKDRDHEVIKGEYEKAQLEISRLAYSRKTEVDPDNYQQFLENLSTLTPTEREIFNLYIEGRSAKDILELAGIKENTLKYHNRNIYSKLCVTSRKELLRFAALMNQEKNVKQ